MENPNFYVMTLCPVVPRKIWTRMSPIGKAVASGGMDMMIVSAALLACWGIPERVSWMNLEFHDGVQMVEKSSSCVAVTFFVKHAGKVGCIHRPVDHRVAVPFVAKMLVKVFPEIDDSNRWSVHYIHPLLQAGCRMIQKMKLPFLPQP